MVAMRRHAEGLLEGACKMKEAQVNELREGGQRNFLGEMPFDEFHQALPLPRRQAATKWPRRFGCRAFRSNEFVHQYEAVVRKDVRLALAEAEKAGVPMLSVGVVRDRLITGIARGHGELDCTALGLIAAEEAGLFPLPPINDE
jgi:hypothetical protein